MQNVKVQQVSELVTKRRRLSLSDGIALLFFTPLFIILIISNWSNVDLLSGSIVFVMVASLTIGLNNLASKFAAVIKKGFDNEFK